MKHFAKIMAVLLIASLGSPTVSAVSTLGEINIDNTGGLRLLEVPDLEFEDVSLDRALDPIPVSSASRAGGSEGQLTVQDNRSTEAQGFHVNVSLRNFKCTIHGVPLQDVELWVDFTDGSDPLMISDTPATVWNKVYAANEGGAGMISLDSRDHSNSIIIPQQNEEIHEGTYIATLNWTLYDAPVGEIAQEVIG
ncbi:WxL domain-containing protein [Lacticaseibacillus brantae]|nr:WxL domain-containing protein [Lacticaseibacillus brantae]